MNTDLVTIIIPIYNAENRLAYAIQSILAQTYSQIELILINDGSIDESLSICKKYAKRDSRIKVISQENAGVSAARNRGLKEARGAFIMFLDADDTIDPEAIQELIHCLDRHESDLAIFGMSFDYYQENTFKHKRELSFNKRLTLSSHEIKEYFFPLYDANYFSSSCNKIFKADIIRKNSIQFEEEMAILEDFKFVLDFLEQTQIISVIPNAYYHYYNNLSSSQLRKRPPIDYMKNFRILDYKLRAFTQRMNLETEENRGKIAGMIFRYYLIAVEKLFLEDEAYTNKYERLKNISQNEDFTRAVNQAKPNGVKLKAIHYLFKLKSVKTLSFIFWLNQVGK